MDVMRRRGRRVELCMAGGRVDTSILSTCHPYHLDMVFEDKDNVDPMDRSSQLVCAVELLSSVCQEICDPTTATKLLLRLLLY